MTEATAPASVGTPRTGERVRFEKPTEIASILVLIGVFFAILMGAMDGLVVATVLPTIAVDLHQENGVTFVAGAYLISSTISIPIFARLSDIASRRNVFLVGLAVFIAGSALAGLSQNLTQLIIFRGIQGIGGGGVFPVAIAMIAVLYPPKIRARVTGVLTGAAGLAIVLGPLVGSYIVSVTTWRWVFYINLPFGVLAMVVLLFAVGPLRPLTRGGFDIPGAALLSGWVGALMVALVEVSDAGMGWTNPLIVGLLGGAVVLFAFFLWLELRSREPLVPLRLMGQRIIAATSGIMFFSGIVFSALITFLSVFVGIVLLQNGPERDERRARHHLFPGDPTDPRRGGLGPDTYPGGVPERDTRRASRLLPFAAFFLTQATASTPLWVASGRFPPGRWARPPLYPSGVRSRVLPRWSDHRGAERGPAGRGRCSHRAHPISPEPRWGARDLAPDRFRDLALRSSLRWRDHPGRNHGCTGGHLRRYLSDTGRMRGDRLRVRVALHRTSPADARRGQGATGRIVRCVSSPQRSRFPAVRRRPSVCRASGMKALMQTRGDSRTTTAMAMPVPSGQRVPCRGPLILSRHHNRHDLRDLAGTVPSYHVPARLCEGHPAGRGH